jgi:hypothetical protein
MHDQYSSIEAAQGILTLPYHVQGHALCVCCMGVLCCALSVLCQCCCCRFFKPTLLLT